MRRKVSNNPAYVAALAGVAALILLIGYRMKPPIPDVEPAVSEQERSQLENLLRREALAATAESLAGVANGLFANVVRVEEAGLGGVAWTHDDKVLLLTPPVASPSVHLLSAAGKRSTAESWIMTNGTVSVADLPFSAFQTPADADVPLSRPVNTQQMRVGQWLIAVWRNPDGRAGFVSGFYGGVQVADCGNYFVREILTSMPLNTGPSAGVFDLNGNLAAFVGPCGNRYLALSLDSVRTILAEANSVNARIERSLGIQLLPLDDISSQHFRAKEGLLVSQVTSGTPADRAGLLPGDVLVSLDQQPVGSPEELEKYIAGTDRKEIDLRLIRQGRGVAAKVSTGAGPPSSGVVLPPVVTGIKIDGVLPGSAAAKAGIQAGDQILSINGTVFRRPADVMNALDAGGEPAYVVLQRENQKLGVFLNIEK